ncbi:hypothetical protein ACHAW6_001177 [Cyclotella cf. meneghiniana]
MYRLPLHRNKHDECGDTASITHESDPETILSCGDADIVQIIRPETVGPDEHHSLDPPQPNESPSHDDTSISADDLRQNPLDPAENETVVKTAGRDMLCELDRIECKIKAAIHANQRIRSNSVELETALREIHRGRVPIDFVARVVHLDSLGEPMSELEISYENILGEATADARRAEELERENLWLRRKISGMDEELHQRNEAQARTERNHREVVEKVKNEAREAKKLVRRLQKKKLADMERNFIASLELLEAKMSEEINNGDEFEERIAAMKAERDTARELNLPLFNDLKRLYVIKTTLEQKVRDLMESEEELIRKEKLADENASRLTDEVLFAHDEISRLTLEMASLAEEKEVQINDLDALVKRLGEESAQKSLDYQDLFARYNNTVMEKEALGATIQQLREENAQLKKTNQELKLENLSYKEKCVSHCGEGEGMRWKLEAMKASTDVRIEERDEQIYDPE